jgi:hypothetical protein
MSREVCSPSQQQFLWRVSMMYCIAMSCMQVYDKTATEKWTRVAVDGAQWLSCVCDDLSAVVRRQIAAKQHFKLFDLDDHFDDISRCAATTPAAAQADVCGLKRHAAAICAYVRLYLQAARPCAPLQGLAKRRLSVGMIHAVDQLQPIDASSLSSTSSSSVSYPSIFLHNVDSVPKGARGHNGVADQVNGSKKRCGLGCCAIQDYESCTADHSCMTLDARCCLN